MTDSNSNSNPPKDLISTPFADRLIAVCQDLVAAANGLLAKAESYKNPGNLKDMHPQVEANARLVIRTLITQIESSTNIPMAYIPSEYTPEPIKLGDASRNEANDRKNKEIREKAVNAIPSEVQAKARAKAQAKELEALKSAGNYISPKKDK